MSKEETVEILSNKRELASIHGKPTKIEIPAMRTIEAYDKAYAEKNMQATNKADYIRQGQGFRQVQRLLQFDAILNPKKGKLTKKVNTMVIQPVGKKLALYYNATLNGYDSWGSPIQCTFNDGYFYSPNLQFIITDVGAPYDPQTGERRGSWKPQGFTYEHFIFVDDNPKTRRKQLEKLIKDKELDVSNTVFSYRLANPENNHQSNHGQISFDNMCDLTPKQLEEIQLKGYYKDTPIIQS